MTRQALKGRHKVSEGLSNLYRSFRAWDISVWFSRGVAAGFIIFHPSGGSVATFGRKFSNLAPQSS